MASHDFLCDFHDLTTGRQPGHHDPVLKQAQGKSAFMARSIIQNQYYPIRWVAHDQLMLKKLNEAGVVFGLRCPKRSNGGASCKHR